MVCGRPDHAGELRSDAGDLEKAEEIDRRALAIMERIERTDDPVYAGLLNNLGEIYRSKEDYATCGGALPALARHRREAGRVRRAFASATTYQNLGIVARERKDYAKAVEYGTRALCHPGAHAGTRPSGRRAAPEQSGRFVYHVTGDDRRMRSRPSFARCASGSASAGPTTGAR